MKYLTIFLLLFANINLYAQQLNGIWQGKLTQEPGGCFPEYYIELQIKTTKDGISGVSYDYYNTSNYVKLNFSGTISGNEKKMLITENKVIIEKIPEECVPCLKTYDLTYNRNNGEESLSGKWVGRDMGSITGCPPGLILLKKVNKSAFSNNYREAVLAKVFILDSPTAKIDFYDNGVIDGDSISVYLDNQVVVSRKALSLTPVSIGFTLTPGKEYEMIVFAESMGFITPNTALVVITSGGKRHEIIIAADDQTNAALRFIYRK
ncbi:hypothetical protein EXU57_19685 [Segetibacter sp. 3557_3]|uniref:hypothetical protein n=1 Tax=Segetibacter sp. 3557_3 TaxID=2547429 RepID=UPI001058B918|nr:hypothetical protein [Segetibacter sp. 3557_3]TDH21423.1 hypothetical protein EXU57_19685 [Segetibacter sp. 3557_3]